jgi:hypothetical protein
MYVHKVSERLQKIIHVLELEVENLATGERSRYREDRDALRSELDLLRQLAATIDAWHVRRAQAAIERM